MQAGGRRRGVEGLSLHTHTPAGGGGGGTGGLDIPSPVGFPTTPYNGTSCLPSLLPTHTSLKAALARQWQASLSISPTFSHTHTHRNTLHLHLHNAFGGGRPVGI